ncbi:MAG: hypothetical protein V3U46_10260 [Acidimicrobiia bacterium]
MTKIRIDAFASQPHYFDHLKPIWDALDAEGTLFVGPGAGRPGERVAALMPNGVPTIVAGYPDLKRIRGRPAIFVEHGIGENYGEYHSHYSGGSGRETIKLFLCPNEHVAEANRRYAVPSVVVGSPWTESLPKRQIEVLERPKVVVSFHWDCRVFAQTKTALYHYQPFFSSWRDLDIMGHAHPRIASRAERLFAAAGIGFIREFRDVVSWADVYAVDNSSTLFEAKAVGLDVVVLDAPHYPPEDTGFRFWKYADIGPRIQTGDQLPEAVLQANYNRVSYDATEMITEIFGAIEGSAARAAKAINDHFGPQGSTQPTASRSEPSQPSLFGIA